VILKQRKGGGKGGEGKSHYRLSRGLGGEKEGVGLSQESILLSIGEKVGDWHRKVNGGEDCSRLPGSGNGSHMRLFRLLNWSGIMRLG